MKAFKKLLTGILAATMIMGASITALASNADATSITITNDKNNNNGEVAKIEYQYYQILKADVKNVSTTNGDGQTGTAAYYVESDVLADLLKETGLFNVVKSADNSRWNVELLNQNTTATQILEAVNTDAFKAAAPVQGTFNNLDENGKVSLSASVAVEPGYYLVLSSLGTKAAIQTLGEVTIHEKNTYTTVTKTEDRDVDAMFDTKKPINYTVTVDVPASVKEADIVVFDKATKGLTINPEVTSSIGKTYTWTKDAEKSTDAYTVFSLTIDKADVIANAGKTITLTYTGTPNEKAVVLVPEQNTAFVQYDNYTSVETEKVEVTTLGFRLVKVDGADKKTTLTGAEFTLWDENGQVYVVPCTATVEGKEVSAYRVANADEVAAKAYENIAVDANGEAVIIGLDAKSYELQEEVAPTGYNLLTERVTVVVSKSTELQKVTVENNSGSVLPSTGGVGTTIFYILGGILIIAGVAYFMLRRKSMAE